MSAPTAAASREVDEIGTKAILDAPILIVDDNAAKRLALRSVLEQLGHSIIEADSGAAALRCVVAQNFAVILLDVRMPRVDGFETAALIRKRRSSELTPIIFITALGSADIGRRDLYAAGAVDFMFAPIPPAELRAKVAAFASLFVKAELLAAQAREVQAALAELRIRNEELADIARRDALTGLGNRRALEDDLRQLDARVARYGHSYCLAILDVDFFKSYNDVYGHLGGDRILRSFAAELKAQARSGDGLYRYGGDEFVCVFPEQSLATGMQAVQRLHRNLARLAIPHEANPAHVVTFSAGLAVLSQDQVKSTTTVLKEADDALYRAKELGRNRIEHLVP